MQGKPFLIMPAKVTRGGGTCHADSQSHSDTCWPLAIRLSFLMCGPPRASRFLEQQGQALHLMGNDKNTWDLASAG